MKKRRLGIKGSYNYNAGGTLVITPPPGDTAGQAIGLLLALTKAS